MAPAIIKPTNSMSYFICSTHKNLHSMYITSLHNYWYKCRIEGNGILS